MATSKDISPDLMQGARNMVRDYVGIAKGHEVIIHTEPGFDDPVLVEAVRLAVEEVGANANVLHTRNWDKQNDPPPPALEHALEGADVLIGQGEYLHTKNSYLQRAIFERGLIYINNEAKTQQTMSSLYGRFPAELLFAIGTAISQKVGRGKNIRVTTEAGTDIEMSVRPETVGGYCYPFQFDSPGHKKGFPGGTACFHPEDPVNGVIAVQAITPGVGAPKSLLDSPMFLTLRDHRVTKFEGDCADWMEKHWREDGDENSGWLAECMWGIHPKASGRGGRGASNPHLLHFGLGNSIAYGGPTYSKTWTVVFTENATLTVDNQAILDKGHLTVLDDPAVRKVAAKYGKPEELLSQVDAPLNETFKR